MKELHDTKETVLLIKHGRPSAYLMDAEAYEMVQERIEILEGIARGERDIMENRVLSHDDAKLKMRKWLN